MKRRSFIKKSVAAAIIAATPMALTGIVNAEGSGGGTGSGGDTTGFFDDTAMTTSAETTISSPACSYSNWETKWYEKDGKCYKTQIIDSCDGMAGNWRTTGVECISSCTDGNPPMQEATATELQRSICR
jgi:hypothetical protein